MMIAEVGEHDYVRMFSQGGNRGHRARDRPLPMHLLFEEAVQQAEDLAAGKQVAVVAIAHRPAEVVADNAEVDPLLVGQPPAERRDHVQQHLVAVADDERPAHPTKASRTWANVSGATSRASAAAIRSASWPSRKSS